MRIGVAILLLVVVCAITVYAVFVACRWLWRRRRPWSLIEESDGQEVNLYAARPGCDRLPVASVPFTADDFDSRIYEARAGAREKLYALNSGRKRLAR